MRTENTGCNLNEKGLFAMACEHVQASRERTIYVDGHVSAKIKVLAAALWSVSARCEPCIDFYIDRAAELGATPEEIQEFMAIAVVMGGCVGEMWAKKALPTDAPSTGGCGCG